MILAKSFNASILVGVAPGCRISYLLTEKALEEDAFLGSDFFPIDGKLLVLLGVSQPGPLEEVVRRALGRH